MDICLPELAQIEDQPAQAPSDARAILADTWVVLWLAAAPRPEESERAAHELCAALPLVTSEDARLN